MREWGKEPFQESLEAVAEIALQLTGAQGYAFFQKSRETGTPVRVAGGGAVVSEVPSELKSDAVRSLVEYPLGTNGVMSASVIFRFSNNSEAQRARPRLDRFAATLHAICAAVATEKYSDLAGRIADLEARLMDSKIADRARGFLTHEANSDPAEAIARHVDGVLRPTPTRRILEQVLSELEEEIQERRLAAEAKQILQALYGISEEQAHTELRLRSRKSRRRLKDVARQVIEEQHLLKGKSA
jgi:hypothetical protein